MVEDVLDLSETPDEKLPLGVEKIIKQHQNEREQMQKMGPLVPLSRVSDSEPNINESMTTALPIPLRRQRYNSSKFLAQNL